MKAKPYDSNSKQRTWTHLYKFVFILVCGCLLALVYAAIWNFSRGNLVNGVFSALIAIPVIIEIIIGLRTLQCINRKRTQTSYQKYFMSPAGRHYIEKPEAALFRDICIKAITCSVCKLSVAHNSDRCSYCGSTVPDASSTNSG